MHDAPPPPSKDDGSSLPADPLEERIAARLEDLNRFSSARKREMKDGFTLKTFYGKIRSCDNESVLHMLSRLESVDYGMFKEKYTEFKTLGPKDLLLEGARYFVHVSDALESISVKLDVQGRRSDDYDGITITNYIKERLLADELVNRHGFGYLDAAIRETRDTLGRDRRKILSLLVGAGYNVEHLFFERAINRKIAEMGLRTLNLASHKLFQEIGTVAADAKRYREHALSVVSIPVFRAGHKSILAKMYQKQEDDTAIRAFTEDENYKLEDISSYYIRNLSNVFIASLDPRILLRNIKPNEVLITEVVEKRDGKNVYYVVFKPR